MTILAFCGLRFLLLYYTNVEPLCNILYLYTRSNRFEAVAHNLGKMHGPFCFDFSECGSVYMKTGFSIIIL